ncbi:MAG TPA: protein sanA-like protein [Bacteroidetes bacterium]|nr:protein sanA-like protein [Bacteroidota bacterium]HRR07284.1 YdcF family protein [Rhodothermales bacterium]
MKRNRLRYISLLPLTMVVWLLGVAIMIYTYASEHDEKVADAAVVLGAAAWYNRPSPVLRERINHAIRLFQSGQVSVLIFTGGKGKGAPMAESEVARRYAIQQGVPASQIHIETVSQTTWENVREATRLTRELGLKRLLLVSDPFHMKRAIRMGRDAGMDVYPAPTPSSRYKTWDTKFDFLLREVYYYSAYVLAGITTNR